MGKNTPGGGKARSGHVADNTHCWYKRYTAGGEPIACRSPRCPSPWCRAKYAAKEWAILARAFTSQSPDYCLTLKITDADHTSDRTLASYLRAFFQRFRDHRKSARTKIEYDARVEFDRYFRPHVHVTLLGGPARTAREVKAVIREWWAKACQGRPVSVYCADVRTRGGWARYATKHLADRRWVYPPPADWDGRRCRLNWYSTGFYVEPKEELWKKTVAEWRSQGWTPVGDTQPPGGTPADVSPAAEVAPTRPGRRPVTDDCGYGPSRSSATTGASPSRPPPAAPPASLAGQLRDVGNPAERPAPEPLSPEDEEQVARRPPAPGRHTMTALRRRGCGPS